MSARVSKAGVGGREFWHSRIDTRLIYAKKSEQAQGSTILAL